MTTSVLLLYNLLLLAVAVIMIVRVKRRGHADRPTVARSGLLYLGAAAVLLAATLPIIGFLRVGILAWALFLYAPLYLASAAVLLRRRRRLAIAAASAAILIWAFALEAVVIEPRWLDVTHVEIRTDKLDAPIKIALLADIQTDDPGDWERDALARVAAEEPDLVLFAGDYIQTHSDEEHEKATARLNEILREAGLDPPLGIVAVRGNIDPVAWPELFDGTGAITGDARTVTDLGPVTVTALSLYEAFNGAEIDAVEDFHIVIGHAPDFALDEPPADLMVAGHTHGGQVRLPFLGPIFTLSTVPRAWAAGVTEVRPGSTLVVSRGLGMERHNAPRVRFLCRPQLIFIDLIPDHGS